MGPVIRELEARGAEVRKLDLSQRLLDDSPRSCVRALTDGMEFLAREFERDKPDVVLLLGDRYETLGAAQVSTMFRIKIAHIHGGEVTEGSFDNEFRNAITQLAQIHFVSAEAHKVRVLNLGVDADRTYVVGAPGLDNLIDLPPQEFQQPYFLVTYHPATKGEDNGHNAILKALEAFPNHGVVWCGVNNDPGRDEIRTAFYALEHITVADVMTPKRYLSAMKYAACCIGNSSSFLIEAPALGVPTVNVGDRQKGRLRGPSVFDAKEEAFSIEAAIAYVLEPPQSIDFTNPYGQPGASKRIAEILTGIDGLLHLEGETVEVLAS